MCAHDMDGLYISAESIKSALTWVNTEFLDFENQHFGELARASGKFRSVAAVERSGDRFW